jgi:membrane protein DedA with SNARE-associated domain
LDIQGWLETVPAVSIYLLVGVVIGVESLGVPLPGEIVLVAAALLASQQGHVNPYVLAAAMAERSFKKWGMWAVFFGRFVALLRIFAGPLAGVLKMRYWKFLTANLLGGVIWAGGTTVIVYEVGKVAEQWLSRFSYVGLAVAVLIGAGAMLLVRRRARKASEETGTEHESTPTASESVPTSSGSVD